MTIRSRPPRRARARTLKPGAGTAPVRLRPNLTARTAALESAVGMPAKIDNALSNLDRLRDRGKLGLGESTLITFRRLGSEGPNAEDDLKKAARILATYGAVMTLDDAAYNEAIVKEASLEHEYLIKLSAANAAEHEALIERGLQGIETYHNGGLTSEDVANFIRAAQAIATAVIAGGVY